MFDSLSDRLRKTLAGLTGRGRVTEADVDAAMREVRLALLEADVNFKVVKEFVATVREKAIGQDILQSLNAGQHFVPDGPLPDPADEVLHDPEIDVRLEERQAHVAHGRVDVGLADPAPAGQVVEGRPQALAEGVEHGPRRTPVGWWTGRSRR